MSTPIDQQIVDDYFRLEKSKSKKEAWLYAMSATYGINPAKLKDFTWKSKGEILIKSKKTPIKPIHPQWIVLFQLKEKQPSKLEDCFNAIQDKLNAAISNQKVRLNFTDLELAYQIRKRFYQKQKADQRKESLSSAVPSLRS